MKTSKTLSPKQKKIAQVAGDPNKIEGEDFKKLKPMKASKGMGAVANRGMGLQDEMLQPGKTTVVGKGSDYIKDLI